MTTEAADSEGKSCTRRAKVEKNGRKAKSLISYGFLGQRTFSGQVILGRGVSDWNRVSTA